MPHILDVVRREQAQIAAGQAEQCNATCHCHGDQVCVRAQHPHVRDNEVPHVAFGDGGDPVQWLCLPSPE